MKHKIRFYLEVIEEIIIDDTINDVSIELALKDAKEIVKREGQPTHIELRSWELVEDRL